MRVLRHQRDHRFTQAHASQYLDGDLSAQDVQRVERHASVCPKCHELIASLRLIVGTLSGLGHGRRPSVAEATLERLRRD